MDVVEPGDYIGTMMAADPPLIVPEEFPELAALVWNGDPARPIHPRDALALYERYWRFVRRDRLTADEAALIDRLVADYGHGHLLV